jgi:hypothetical protein
MRPFVVAVTLVASATLALATASTAVAQGVPDLSGTWVLVPEKSDFGMMPVPTSRTDVIDHKEPAITVKRTVVNAQGEAVLNLVYAVDGKPHANTAGENQVNSTLKWEGRVLVMMSTATTPNGEIGINDRFALSGDGKTLTQNRTINAQGQEINQTIVLAKQ